MRVVGYVRVSRVGGREGESFISPAVQRERIEAWGRSHRHDIVAWFEDLDQPGSRADRPGLVEAMRLIEDGEAKGIAVAKLDRFGRSVVHLAALIERLRAAGGALFAVAEGIDTRGTTGKLVADIFGAIAEWELGRVRENWDTARAAAAARGVYLAEAPVGYTKLEDGRLDRDDRAGAIIGAFERRAAGESWASIARWLSGQVPSRRGGEWTVSALRRMIANRAYLGETSHGQIVTRGAHEALVGPALFAAANVSRGVAPERSGASSGLLSGILRCAGCRYAMKLSSGRTRHGQRKAEYRCKAAGQAAAGGRCSAPASVSAHLIDGVVLDVFWATVADYRARGVRSDEALVDAEAAVREAEAELDAALDRRLVDALGAESEAYLRLVRSRQEALEVTRDALGAERRRARASALPDVDLRKLWPDLNLYEQRKLLASVLDCVFLRRAGGPTAARSVPIGERVWVCLNGEAPELPTRGQRWSPVSFEFPSAPKAG